MLLKQEQVFAMVMIGAKRRACQITEIVFDGSMDPPTLYAKATAAEDGLTYDVRKVVPEGQTPGRVLTSRPPWILDAYGRFNDPTITFVIGDRRGDRVADALKAAGIEPSRAMVKEIQLRRQKALEEFDTEWLAVEASHKAESAK